MSGAPESAAASLAAWLAEVCPGWPPRPYPGKSLVYHVFGTGETLLYIGSTIDLETRFMRHWTHSDWFPEVRRITIEWMPTLKAARAAEKAAIAAEHPERNRAGTSRDGRLRANRASAATR